MLGRVAMAIGDAGGDIGAVDLVESTRELFGPLETEGFAFDVELLLRAQAAGYRIIEVAVNWADQEGSKVGVLTTGPGMLVQVVKARRRLGCR